MRIYSLNPDSTTEKTSVMYALSRGYQFRLSDVDGNATVINPEGEEYHIHNWRCDCQDSINRDGGTYTLGNTETHVCKHCLWIAALYPCPNCHGYMMLRMESWKVYQCCTPACYTMIPFQKVKVERQHSFRLREQEADTDKVVSFPQPPNPIKAAQAAEASRAIFAH